MEPTPHREHEPVDRALEELERVADEIRVKIHLAGMDARETWSKTLEPKLFDVRDHARRARASSREAVRELVEALKTFYGSL
jgi:hypothetical protein